jgi:ribonuclease HII
MTKTASPTFNLEKSCSSFNLIAGIDEAGCGPLAGPVIAGAVIFLTYDLPSTLQSLIHDSKKLTEKKRTAAFEIMDELKGTVLHYGIGIAEVREIDQLNIGRATRLAMERSVLALPVQPEFALIDGIRKPNLGCPSLTVVKGDATSLSIAAASIFAKVTRDRLMQTLDLNYPAYGWGKNAGYGTAHHLQAIHTHGITLHHRKSFEPIKTLMGVPVQAELF